MFAWEGLLNEDFGERVLDVYGKFGVWPSGHSVHRLAGGWCHRHAMAIGLAFNKQASSTG